MNKYKIILILLIFLILILSICIVFTIYIKGKAPIPDTTVDSPKKQVEATDNFSDELVKFKSFYLTTEDTSLLSSMEQKDNYYYVQLNDYAEYKKYKEKWNTIRDLTENDFNNYFAFIVLTQDNLNRKIGISKKFDLVTSNIIKITRYEDTFYTQDIQATGMFFTIPRQFYKILDIEEFNETR